MNNPMSSLLIRMVRFSSMVVRVCVKRNIGIQQAVLLLFLTFNISAYAQQDPLFSQYMFNKLVVNPAYAGSREVFTADLLNRYQWVGIEGAPKTLTVSVHTLLKSSKVGIGAYLYRDEIGPTINQGFMATYAYRLQTEKGWFSMGIHGGFKYFDLDWNAISIREQDYMFYPQDIRKVNPDVNLGFYYQTRRFFAGLSSKHLLENEYAVGEVDGVSSFSKLSKHFYGMAGVAMPLNDKFVFRPSMLVKFVQDSPVQFDINGSILFDDVLWAGISFRTEKAVVFMTEFEVADFIRLGYSFDLYLNELQLHNKGSHEFRLGFDIYDKKTRMKTPRYF